MGFDIICIYIFSLRTVEYVRFAFWLRRRFFYIVMIVYFLA